MTQQMHASSKELLANQSTMRAALLKPAALAVVLGFLGASVPFAVPEMAQSGYRASVQLRLNAAADSAVSAAKDLKLYLEKQLTSEASLKGALSAVKVNPFGLGVSTEPSLIALLSDLMGLTQSSTYDRDASIFTALRERLLIESVAPLPSDIKISFEAEHEGLAKALAEHFSLAAQAEIALYQQTPADLELTKAREALDQVEAQLSGFQLKHGSERIAQMESVAQEFAATKIALQKLRQELRVVSQALEFTKSLKPSTALAQALPQVLGLDALRDLQQAHSSAKAHLASLGADYGPKHPKVLAAQGNLDQVAAGVAKALRQSREELQHRNDGLTADLKSVEQRFSELDEQMTKLGSAPDELAMLESRLDVARQHYLSLSEIAGNAAPKTVLSADVLPKGRGTQSVINYGLLALYSALSGLGLAVAGFVLGRKVSDRSEAKPALRQVPVPVPAAKSLPKAAKNTRPMPDEVRGVQRRERTPLEPRMAAPKSLVQDNDAPFDQQVKALLMRNAVKDSSAALAHLPPLVRAAALGQITFSQAEMRELSAIQRELDDLRHALDVQQSAKSRRTATFKTT